MSKKASLYKARTASASSLVSFLAGRSSGDLGLGVGVFMLPNVPAVAGAGQAKGFGNGGCCRLESKPPTTT